jgi:hypothetical protein
VKGLKWAASAGGGAFVAALALPAFVSLDTFRDDFARIATDRMKEKVAIGRVRASLLPWPRLTASDVSIGNAEELKVGSVVVTPRLMTLLAERKVMRAVEIRDLSAKQQALQRLAALVTAGDRSAGAVHVEKVAVDNAVVVTERGELGPFRANIGLAPHGRPERASLHTSDGKLQISFSPQGENYTVTVEAKDWTLPWGPALEFKTLRMQGTLTADEAHFRDARAAAYGGTARGELRIAWNTRTRISGDLTLKDLDLAGLLGAFSAKTRLTGRIDAKPVFGARIEEGVRPGRALQLRGPFRIHDAVLEGVDLRAAANLVKQDERTGTTRFDELSGELALERGTFRFTNLRALSGALAARGDVTLSPQKALSGRVHAQVKPIGAVADVPLNVSGTLESPTLTPTGASVAGAAVGTAVLGPGIGTSLGAKIGDLAEEILGGGGRRRK